MGRLWPRRASILSRVDRSIKERIGALVVPIGSRGRFKTSERAAVEPWHARRIEEHDLPAGDRICQRAEQRQVILAAEEHDVVFRVVWQHAEIVISIRLATALVGVGARAEGDIVGRRQKIGTDQAPASGEPG